MKVCIAAVIFLLVPFVANAADPGRIERDLGDGLTYVRARALPADLPESPTKPTALVLDLRYVHANENAAKALGAWLQFHASLRTPVYVLVNNSTATDILNFLESEAPSVGVITVGTASSRFVPDIPLKISPVTERYAYDALDHGTTLESLLTDEPGKVRHDEASIAQEHSVPPEVADDLSDGLSDAPMPPAAVTPPARPLIDSTLQRAVQLHRTLRALRRI